MTIICPGCGFSAEVPDEKYLPKVVKLLAQSVRPNL